MSELNESSGRSRRAFLPNAIAIPLAALLILIFIALLFPWDSLGRRIAWEINRASGARVSVPELGPALTARGPVLRARNVTIEHPAVELIQVHELEIAPRFSTSWFGGDPTLRIWAQTGLGNADGVLQLGESPAYVGRVSQAELSRLPLRLEATGVRFHGVMNADADVQLDPNGTLKGRVVFDSSSLEISSNRLPIAIPFTKSSGTVEILDSGATRIADIILEGPVLNAEVSGEISFVHRSQSPPIDLTGHLQILDPTLRQLASGAGLQMSPQGEATLRLSGTLDAPLIEPEPEPARGRGRGSR